MQAQPATPPPADLGVPSTATDKRNTDAGPPSSESATIKRRCATRIFSLIPRPVARSFWGSPASPDRRGNHGDADLTADGKDEDEDRHYIQTIESDLLDLFADEYCNKHLLYAIVELVLVRLLPELKDRGVTELLEVRGVTC